MNDFQTFWYVLATGLAGVLVVIIGRYISKTLKEKFTELNRKLKEKVLEKLSDNVSELKATAAVHAQKLKEHDDKIDTLSDDVANQIIAKLRMITPRK